MASISGLVSITPGSGYVSPQISYVFGLTTGFVTWSLVYLRKKYKFLDDLDVFACHGVAGMLGIILTGLFASVNVNPTLTSSGLVYAYLQNEPDKYFLAYQVCSIVVVSAYASVMTYVILIIMSKIFQIKAKSQEEAYNDQLALFDDFQKNKGKTKEDPIEVIR
jgi:Amt family ammonium transporter